MSTCILYSPGGRRAAVLAHDPECEEAALARARLMRRGVNVVELPREHAAWLACAPRQVRDFAVSILRDRGKAAAA